MEVLSPELQKKIEICDDFQLCQYTLNEWLLENMYHEPSIIMGFFKQIVSAVAYIHEKGRLHRDLKVIFL